MVKVDRDGRSLPIHMRVILAALAGLGRLGVLGSIVVWGAISGLLMGGLWLLGKPFEWKFILAFALIGPVMFGLIDLIMGSGDRPASKASKPEQE